MKKEDKKKIIKKIADTVKAVSYTHLLPKFYRKEAFLT